MVRVVLGHRTGLLEERISGQLGGPQIVTLNRRPPLLHQVGFGWALPILDQLDKEIGRSSSMVRSRTPVVALELALELRQLGTAWFDALEGLALQVHVESGVVDLPVEAARPAHGLGMVTVEVVGGVTLALERA